MFSALLLAPLLRAAMNVNQPISILAGAYLGIRILALGTRILALLTALYGSEKLSKRACKVLRILRHKRNLK